MSTLIRWNPESEMMTLREAMDRLFDDAFTRPLRLAGATNLPAVNMYQTDGEVVVQATLPGFKEDEVKINITGDILSLHGEFKHEEEKEETAYHLHEQHFASFERSVVLPADVKAEEAEASFEDGILTITLPIDEKVKPKTITIKPK